MTSGKLIFVLTAFLLLTSCGNEDEVQMYSNDSGRQLKFEHVATDSLSCYANSYWEGEFDAVIADLRLQVQACFKVRDGVRQQFLLRAQYDIEKEIKDFLDPNGDRYDVSPYLFTVPTRYTTAECENISIYLCNPDSTFIKEITDKARFYYVWHSSEDDAWHVWLNADRKVIGKLAIGTTIKEYLSSRPMLFSDAHFIFPEILKEEFEDNLVRVDIDLGEGGSLSAFASK